MAVQTLTLGGRKFVILPESEYRKLRGKSAGNGKSLSGQVKRATRSKRVTTQEAGDVAEAKRRAAEPNLPYQWLRKEMELV
jgi:hypothetical protein